MIENVGHDIKTENTFEEYPIEESTFSNFYIDEQNDGKKHHILAEFLSFKNFFARVIFLFSPSKNFEIDFLSKHVSCYMIPNMRTACMIMDQD